MRLYSWRWVQKNEKLSVQMLKFSTLLFLLFSCSICYCQTDTIFITDNIPILKVKENEPFVLKFLACHSCGYNWKLNKVDTSYVKVINVTSKHTSGRNDIVGGSVYEFWKFEVVASGSYSLEFVYKRSWLKDNEKVVCVELNVN
jgi:predicted secreted protein